MNDPSKPPEAPARPAFAFDRSPESVARDLRRHMTSTLGRDAWSRTGHSCYQPAALAVRDRLIERRYATERDLRARAAPPSSTASPRSDRPTPGSIHSGR